MFFTLKVWRVVMFVRLLLWAIVWDPDSLKQQSSSMNRLFFFLLPRDWSRQGGRREMMMLFLLSILRTGFLNLSTAMSRQFVVDPNHVVNSILLPKEEHADVPGVVFRECILKGYTMAPGNPDRVFDTI